MTVEYLCPECRTRVVTADVHRYECESCGGTWDSLSDLAEAEPQTDYGQRTLSSVTDPGDES